MVRSYSNYIDALANCIPDSQTPEIFREWCAVSAVAGALGRKVWYDMGTFQIRPNLFVVLIAGPGRGKSLGLIIPFSKVFKALSTMPGTVVGDESFNLLTHKYGVQNAPLHCIQDRITPEQLTVDMSKLTRTNPRLSTPMEKFKDSSITITTSEFGSFMNRKDQYLQMFMTDMWDCKSEFSYRTKTAGDFLIEGPCLNWIACATPDQFIENLPENARSQGLLSRMIPVYFDGPKLQEDIFYGTVKPTELENLRENLAVISKIEGEYVLDEEIKEEVRQEIKEGVRPIPTDPNLAEYLQRRTAQLFKLAIVYAASRRDKRCITAEDWASAKRLLLAAERDMPKALSGFGMGDAGRTVRELVIFMKEKMRNSGQRHVGVMLLKRQALRIVRNPGEVEQIVATMVSSNMISVEGNKAFLKEV